MNRTQEPALSKLSTAVTEKVSHRGNTAFFPAQKDLDGHIVVTQNASPVFDDQSSTKDFSALSWIEIENKLNVAHSKIRIRKYKNFFKVTNF